MEKALLITKKSTTYEITREAIDPNNKPFTITVEKDETTGKLSISGRNGQSFLFSNSRPEIVAVIAEMLLEASKL